MQQCIQKGISDNIEAYHTNLADSRLAQKAFTDAQHHYDTARYLTGNQLLTYRKAIAYDAAGQGSSAVQFFRLFLKNTGSTDTALVRYAKQRAGSGRK